MRKFRQRNAGLVCDRQQLSAAYVCQRRAAQRQPLMILQMQFDYRHRGASTPNQRRPIAGCAKCKVIPCIAHAIVDFVCIKKQPLQNQRLLIRILRIPCVRIIFPGQVNKDRVAVTDPDVAVDEYRHLARRVQCQKIRFALVASCQVNQAFLKGQFEYGKQNAYFMRIRRKRIAVQNSIYVYLLKSEMSPPDRINLSAASIMRFEIRFIANAVKVFLR